jgi:hypothetical protein
MTKKYENKSNSNGHFLKTIHEDYPEDFFDWKVTAQFYTSLHKCYCVIISEKCDVETSHRLNIQTLKGINKTIAEGIFTLYKNSRQSRYDGFLTEEAMLRVNKINFDAGVGIMRSIELECAKHYPVPTASV